MTTSILRTLQQEWNALVPAARSRGIPRVRMLRIGELNEPISYRREKLNWLRAQLGVGADELGFSFGPEIECLLSTTDNQTALARAITDAGIDCRQETYNHTTRTWWKVTTDGSLGDYRRGTEVVAPPIRGEAGFDQLRRVCDTLVSRRARITKKCGFHVHVGAQTQPVQFFKNLIRFYAAAEDVIDSFMAPSRRPGGDGEGWCRSVKTYDRRRLESATTIDDVCRANGQTPGRQHVRSHTRYRKVNLQSWWQHGTVEFRQHQGTVEATKAEHWVRFCMKMCKLAESGWTHPDRNSFTEYGRQVGRPSDDRSLTFDEVMAAVGATDVEKNYFAGRIAYFREQSERRRAA